MICALKSHIAPPRTPLAAAPPSPAAPSPIKDFVSLSSGVVAGAKRLTCAALIPAVPAAVGAAVNALAALSEATGSAAAFGLGALGLISCVGCGAAMAWLAARKSPMPPIAAIGGAVLGTTCAALGLAAGAPAVVVLAGIGAALGAFGMWEERPG